MLSGEWREHTATPPDTPTPCHGACSAAIRNTIYSFGGWTSSKKHSDEFYKLDLDEMRWRKVEGGEIKPEGREGAGMCRVNGNSKLLLMGGYGRLPHTKHPQAQYKDNEHENGFGWNNELFEFDPCTDCWSALSVTGSKPSPRADHTLTTLDEKRAILFGGWDGEKSLNDLWLFDYGKKVLYLVVLCLVRLDLLSCDN
jgi:N-acetylneuraminic acid mutarotase